VKYPELAILQFTVRDENMTGKDAILGTYAVPICSIQQGIISCNLSEGGIKKIVNSEQIRAVETSFCMGLAL
jgi:hypothetical protein